MVSNLEIDGFRGIRYAAINDLAQVNLFFGKNNCGKSSVLESLLLLYSVRNPVLPLAVNQARGYFKSGVDDLRLNFYGLRTDRPIRIAASNAPSKEIVIRMYESVQKSLNLENANLDSAFRQKNEYGLRISLKRGDETYESSLDLVQGETSAKTNPASDYQDTPIVYLPSAYMQIDTVEILSNILAAKQERALISILKIIEPKIASIQLIGHDVMVDVGLDKFVPINLMGDGIRKCLAIVLSIMSCQGGMIMIDEIDNGFHHSVMDELWNTVIATAKVFNTQVFATTHNIDSVRGLCKGIELNPNAVDDVAAFKLMKLQTDEVKALRYGYEQLSCMMDQNVEVR